MFEANLYLEWIKFIDQVEVVFTELGFQKVHTPYLVKSPSMEAYLEGFKIKDTEFYLPTSPEFGLKKLWTQGGAFSKIFEVSKSFRSCEEGTPFHLSEFTMLEVYESEVTVFEFKTQLTKALKSILNLKNTNSFEHIDLMELFKSLTGFELSPQTSKEHLQEVLNSLSLGWSDDDNLNDLFQRIYLELIEPSFNPNAFLYLSPFPYFLSALAKINPEGHADRFELYFNGVELANGYNELLSSEKTLQRWTQENSLREEMGKTPHPIDHQLLDSLDSAPFSQGVGVAIGLERLFYVKKLLEGEKLEGINFSI